MWHVETTMHGIRAYPWVRTGCRWWWLGCFIEEVNCQVLGLDKAKVLQLTVGIVPQLIVRAARQDHTRQISIVVQLHPPILSPRDCLRYARQVVYGVCNRMRASSPALHTSSCPRATEDNASGGASLLPCMRSSRQTLCGGHTTCTHNCTHTRTQHALPYTGAALRRAQLYSHWRKGSAQR